MISEPELPHDRRAPPSNPQTVRPLWLGDSALLFPRPAEVAFSALQQAAMRWPGVRDVVITADEMAVYFDPRHPPEDWPDLPARLQCAAAVAVSTPRLHTCPVIYGGPDLDAFAKACGLSTAELIRRHSGVEYRVAMLGFLPGFAYLEGLDPQLIQPRRREPRARIEPNTLAVGGPYTAVYPCASPGGWHLLGRAPSLVALDANGASWKPDDRVRFVPEA